MEPAPLHLEASSCEALNQQLRELSLSSSPTLFLTTPGWHATSWELITSGCTESPLIRLSGQAVIPRLLESAGNRQRWRIEPYCSQPSLPEQQWLQISWHENQCGELLQLQASDAISPWQLFQLLRPDAAKATLIEGIQWLASNGIHEANLLRHHPTVLAALNQSVCGTNLPWLHWAIRQERKDLQATFEAHNTTGLRHWIHHHGAAEHRLGTINDECLLVAERVPLQPWKQRPFGVNLFGYAGEALGIGEDLRTVHNALLQAGIEVKVIDIPTKHSDTELREQAQSNPDQLAPFAFNLVCLTAEEHARVLLELGEGVFQERHTIGYWPWELSRWPQVWQPLLVMANEVWASSSHTHGALQTALGERFTPQLQHLPLPLEPLEPLSDAARLHWRQEFALPPTSPLVICSFDGRSSYARKNPWGAIQAFQQALPPDSEVRLVIKTMHAGLAEHHWHQLQARVEADPRLLLIDGVLPREQLLGLYGCSDVLLSLHRAEGYGRVLAESLLLGLDVIATGYSGNSDFCIGPLAHPVNYTLLPVLPDEYPYADNQVWAEPDEAQASRLLQSVLAQRAAEPNRRFSQSTAYRHLFSPAVIGQRYAQRLQQIWSNR